MTRKRTPEEFISKSSVKHNNFYDYSNTLYISAKEKISIICPLHGSFEQVAENHIQGSGCPICARLGTIKNQKHSREDFIKNAEKANQGKDYNYSKVEYINSKTKVVVICPKHGEFLTLPSDHVKGHGCDKCAREQSAESRRSNIECFSTKSCDVHENKYSYEKVEYKNNNTNVNITCPVHGSFWQTPSNHLQGAGCPECGKSGFNRNKPASLYILRCGNMTKVGITNVAVTKRLKQLSGSSKHEYTIFHSQYFELGENALNLETKTLQYLKSLYKQPEEKFQGSTECFFDVDIEELMKYVSPKAV